MSKAFRSGELAQLVRALRSHRRGRWFEPDIPHHFYSGGIAQLGARLLRMQKARGSNPLISTKTTVL